MRRPGNKAKIPQILVSCLTHGSAHVSLFCYTTILSPLEQSSNGLQMKWLTHADHNGVACCYTVDDTLLNFMTATFLKFFVTDQSYVYVSAARLSHSQVVSFLVSVSDYNTQRWTANCYVCNCTSPFGLGVWF